MPVEMPTALSIAGSDSGGGAGIQADLLTFARNGVFGTTAITCLTAQNPDVVSDIRPMDKAFVRAQLHQVGNWFQLGAVKTGMLFNRDIISTVADFLRERGIPAVVDPVMVATSGAVLLEKAAITTLEEELLPLATCLTPNLDEAAILLGREKITKAGAEEAAAELTALYKVPVLLKGGHLEGNEVVDILTLPDGTTHHFRFPRIENVNTHGSGCTLSSAIAARIALGRDLKDAIGYAISYLRKGMERPCILNGQSFIAH